LAVLAAGLGCLGGLSRAGADDGYGCQRGYRQQSVLSDFALGRVWAVYSSCAHPEAPRLAVILDRSSSDRQVPDRPAPDRTAPDRTALDRPVTDRAAAAAPSLASSAASYRGVQAGPSLEPPLVRAGSPVRLWLSSPVARIALAGMALENGASGATIRVRVMPGGKVLDGTVRAADSVELVASGFAGAGQ